MTFPKMAPTKNPSSRLKSERQLGQWCLMRKGPRAIDDWPQAGQRNRSARAKTVTIDRPSRFTLAASE